MKVAIIIPARWGSTRFAGKPLAMIDGQTMLSRVIDIANSIDGASVFVATEDARIKEHAVECGANAVITSVDCASGSDRVLAALDVMDEAPDFVVNLQGDAPFTPPLALQMLIDAFFANQEIGVVTPVRELSWEGLDELRASKKTSAFSGTTAIVDKNGRALWFSKNILPAIRGEDKMRDEGARCPVLQHMGLYGFRPDVLRRFCALPPSHYETLEGLEQLRLLEAGIPIHTVTVPTGAQSLQGGIDTIEDLRRAENTIRRPEGQAT